MASSWASSTSSTFDLYSVFCIGFVFWLGLVPTRSSFVSLKHPLFSLLDLCSDLGSFIVEVEFAFFFLSNSFRLRIGRVSYLWIQNTLKWRTSCDHCIHDQLTRVCNPKFLPGSAAWHSLLELGVFLESIRCYVRYLGRTCSSLLPIRFLETAQDFTFGSPVSRHLHHCPGRLLSHLFLNEASQEQVGFS